MPPLQSMSSSVRMNAGLSFASSVTNHSMYFLNPGSSGQKRHGLPLMSMLRVQSS